MAPVRAFVVRRAEAMTDEAANLLLKLLEEPPAGAVLVLTTDRPQDVLPTLRSRCRVLRDATADGAAAPAADAAAPYLAGQWAGTGWADALPDVALALRAALKAPGSVPLLRDRSPADLLALWQAVVEAARDLEANANRDLVRHRLTEAFAHGGR
jgi:DNA polymerase-3 subunit delta'